MKTTYSILILLVSCSLSFGQMDQYNFKSELQGVSDTWHTIELPDDCFGNSQQSLQDVRVFGITSENDTIEVPYILQKKSKSVKSETMSFKILNQTNNSGGYYYTFQLPSEEAINHVSLEFENKNFDWKVSLEGSQDNKEWFTIVKDKRILSFVNNTTNYQYTDIDFATAKYQYFRLTIPRAKAPILNSATLKSRQVTPAIYKNFNVTKFQVAANNNKQTVIDVMLDKPQPVSFLKLNVADAFDYYRNLKIEHLTDSISTEQGWRYNYATLSRTTLSSLDTSGYAVPSTTAERLKLTISNYDNEPLSFTGVEIKGYTHQLIARFTKDASYFLVYGNENAKKPNYDIVQFKDKIPVEITPLNFGTIVAIEKNEAAISEPLFENKIWLWGIMGVICLVLGYFSLKMLRK